ncbi:succinate dehydrogenase, hydrophobic membrane anchor protein [Blochmannia endosymbiont of Polyrhachis (Hedomyrma) turneri]|uniref:succinate dehydrogenase, hydrophobic membrane anchor protein n=1 Tax=Blochmannia endosymbiont of Polyrhachis (Hedomyrma) turneri TaxID=1505596 RepID=UPI00061A6DB5|nr:succinate dehydrogenase, hydrophobic membrane anchor protein [Blochmannia endosymbiont of Polyrhachis (Hedomyrma) turneri]AKC59897.1 Succinate dehydrogenase hydrophobic membrane anchor subunit [Blochmannia endosymbiont of Polyrhachis (Hedomyrma) turneri]
MRNILITLKKLKWNATYEWLTVRCSAVLILIYIIYLLWFFSSVDFLTYELWRAFFSKKLTKTFNFFALFALLIHSWIGISHILVDYVKNSILYGTLRLITLIIFFMYFLCGMNLIWSI